MLDSRDRWAGLQIMLEMRLERGLSYRKLHKCFPANPGESAWEQFSKDENLRRQNNITPEEMKLLSQVPMLGQANSPKDFIYILNMVCQIIRNTD